RVLPTPRQLNADPRGSFYRVETPPTTWGVFCLDTTVTVAELKIFIETLMDRARYFGINLAMPCPVTTVEIKELIRLDNLFYNLKQKCNAEFVFVGIPPRKCLRI